MKDRGHAHAISATRAEYRGINSRSLGAQQLAPPIPQSPFDLPRASCLGRGHPFADPHDAREEPKVCRLPGGGNWIRTCMGLFLSSSCFWFMASFLFGAGKPFFIPSPAIRFAELRGRGQGTEMLASLAACRLAALVFRSALRPEHAQR